ncbi:hypothetical protein TNCV_1628241 [Trichonephila clavipes]|nr:hypothetical protein TNCV_1628241 [Trichonephila clavipes]
MNEIKVNIAKEHCFQSLFRRDSSSKPETDESQCEIRSGGWCKRSQPRVAIWFCIAVTECGLALSSNNRTPDLRPRRHCDTLVPTSKNSTQK